MHSTLLRQSKVPKLLVYDLLDLKVDGSLALLQTS
jgi:hypothetical protein